jgi:aryl-alcohol dehydrogenase-like predicted oxidoreductase
VTHNLHAQSIRAEMEGSLRRLETERIDLYQIHWPFWPSSPRGHDAGSLDEAWETLAALQREGKARYIGVSNCDAEQLARLERIAPVTSLQPPYSLLNRDIETRTLPFCREHNIGVIVYSPMQSGLLTGKMTRERIAALPENDWRRSSPYLREPRLTRALQVVDELQTVGSRHGRTPGEVAIAWTLRDPAVTGAIVGARRPDQVNEIVGAQSFRLSDAEIQGLEQALAREGQVR